MTQARRDYEDLMLMKLEDRVGRQLYQELEEDG